MISKIHKALNSKKKNSQIKNVGKGPNKGFEKNVYSHMEENTQYFHSLVKCKLNYNEMLTYTI